MALLPVWQGLSQGAVLVTYVALAGSSRSYSCPASPVSRPAGAAETAGTDVTPAAEFRPQLP